jgi:hypothetical protein
MSDTILVVNSGSSSIKFELRAVGPGNRLERRMKGQIEGIGTHPRLLAKGTKGDTLVDENWAAKDVSSVPAAIDKLVTFLRDQIGGELPISPSSQQWIKLALASCRVRIGPQVSSVPEADMGELNYGRCPALGIDFRNALTSRRPPRYRTAANDPTRTS